MGKTKTEKKEISEGIVYKPKKVLNKRVIFVQIDDEIVELYEKLSKVNAKRIYFVIPQRSLIFQSIVNIKLLKQKADENKKKIYFITNDVNGINLAKQLGIKVYDKVNNDNNPSLFSSKASEDFINITPLKASVNAIIEHTPTRLAEKKLSISELLKKGQGKKVSQHKASSFTKNEKEKPSGKDNKEKADSSYKLKFSAPNKGPIVAFLSLTFVVVFAIIYVALPSATIIITPSASVIDQSINITLADSMKNRRELEGFPVNMIASHNISRTISRKADYISTGKKVSEKGGNASGFITVYNDSSTSWSLIARTRFQTQEGINFRIKEAISIPAKGSLKVFVEADIVDEHGQIVGARGNIGPSKFFLPGLQEESRRVVYAESFEDMTGGVTDFVTYISEADIDGAKRKLEDQLKKDVLEELRNSVSEISKETSRSVDFVLLEEQGYVDFSRINIDVPANLIGSERKEFEISGSITANGIYYDRSAIVEILKNELLSKKSPQKELLRINENSISYRIFDRDQNAGKIRLTANIKGIEQYDIDPNGNTGRRFLEKIRVHIAGRDIEYVKSYIQNLPEVNKVEIKSWPAWSPTIPKLEENIKFDIKQAQIVN